MTAKGSVSGQFTHFIDPFTARPGLNTIDLVYGRNFVQLQFLDLTSPISPVIPVVRPERHGIYLNGAIYGGGNSYSSARSGLGGLNGSTSGAEWSTFISGGYDFRLVI